MQVKVLGALLLTYEPHFRSLSYNVYIQNIASLTLQALHPAS